MRGCRRVARHIEHRAAPDGDHIRVPIKATRLDRTLYRNNVRRAVLDAFAAFDDQRWAGEREERAIALAVCLDGSQQARMVLADPLIEHPECPLRQVRALSVDDVLKEGVVLGK